MPSSSLATSEASSVLSAHMSVVCTVLHPREVNCPEIVTHMRAVCWISIQDKFGFGESDYQQHPLSGFCLILASVACLFGVSDYSVRS